MPTYTFKDTTTGEVFDKIMKISEREDYLKSNPHLETVITAPNIVDPIRLSGLRPPEGFKEVLKNIHARTSGSKLKDNGNI